MDITILGSGCANCRALEQAARDAVESLGLDAAVEHVTDPAEIAAWGVLRTPALAVDGDVVLAGRVPTAATLRDLLAQRA